MTQKVSKFIYWTPRIFSILFAMFLAMFSLDVIEYGYSLWEIVIGLLIHNIPVFIMIAIIIISWKREIVGGVAFLLAGLLYMVLTAFGDIPWYLTLSWSLIISGPAFLIGILFLMGWSQKRQR